MNQDTSHLAVDISLSAVNSCHLAVGRQTVKAVGVVSTIMNILSVKQILK